jgi:hypothetical protein
MVGPLDATTVGLVQLQLAKDAVSEDETIEELPTAGTRADQRGWMSEKFPCSGAGRIVFS